MSMYSFENQHVLFCANHIPLTWCIGRSQLNGDPIDGHQIPVTATTARHGKLQRNLIGKPSKGRVHNGVAHDGVGDPNDIVDVGRGGRAPLPTGMGRGGGGATVVVPDHDVDAHPFDTKDPGKKKIYHQSTSVYMYHGANNSIGRCTKVFHHLPSWEWPEPGREWSVWKEEEETKKDTVATIQSVSMR